MMMGTVTSTTLTVGTLAMRQRYRVAVIGTVRDNKPEDETGHGTHVSGIIAAAANNGIGIAGIAWKCRLMPLRAGFKYGGGEYLQNDDLAAAIVYAADNGARVINMSWGDWVNAFIIEDALAYANTRGCVLVGASGNSGALGSYYPAALKTVLFPLLDLDGKSSCIAILISARLLISLPLARIFRV